MSPSQPASGAQDLVPTVPGRLDPVATAIPDRSGATPGRIAIVSPVFDDWTCLSFLLSDLSARFARSKTEFYVCVVDDGSTTPFDMALFSLPEEGCIIEIEVLRLALNLGHQRAIAVGLCAVAERDDIDAVLVMDSDGEDSPDGVAALLASAAANPGQVVLARRDRRSESLTFRAWYALYKLLFHVLTGQVLNFGNFSLLPMAAVRRVVHMPELWNNLAATLIRSRLYCVPVGTIRGRRYDGRSRMGLVGLIIHGLSALSVHVDTIFVRVLLTAAAIGMAALLGIVAVAVIRLASDLAIPGWATTAAGELMIILLQTIVVIVAATLMMLANRSSRPIIPIVDARQFVSHRESHRIGVAAPRVEL